MLEPVVGTVLVRSVPKIALTLDALVHRHVDDDAPSNANRSEQLQVPVRSALLVLMSKVTVMELPLSARRADTSLGAAYGGKDDKKVTDADSEASYSSADIPEGTKLTISVSVKPAKPLRINSWSSWDARLVDDSANDEGMLRAKLELTAVPLEKVNVGTIVTLSVGNSDIEK
jgi:hypothetical protein